MLRRTLLFLSGQPWLRHWMETSPASRKFTARFVAGRTLDEALRVASQLAAEGIQSSLDFLGENVTSIDEAAASRESYLKALDGIASRRLAATVSIKLSQFGLDISEQICLNNVAALVDRARRLGTRVEIDMESAAYTDRTLDVIREMHRRFGGNVRAVIQAYLRRSEQDVIHLSREGIPVRLCKGAYREPVEVAYQQKSEVDRNYLRLMKILLETGTDPAIASHDEAILDECVSYVREKDVARNQFEFQMLYGIRRDLQRKLTHQGFRLRSYVPYGDAWYPYFMRRLAERPANLLFVAKNVLRG
jgi:proline dehydrogenase